MTTLAKIVAGGLPGAAVVRQEARHHVDDGPPRRPRRGTAPSAWPRTARSTRTPCAPPRPSPRSSWSPTGRCTRAPTSWATSCASGLVGRDEARGRARPLLRRGLDLPRVVRGQARPRGLRPARGAATSTTGCAARCSTTALDCASHHGWISAVHTDDDIERTVAAYEKALARHGRRRQLQGHVAGTVPGRRRDGRHEAPRQAPGALRPRPGLRGVRGRRHLRGRDGGPRRRRLGLLRHRRDRRPRAVASTSTRTPSPWPASRASSCSTRCPSCCTRPSPSTTTTRSSSSPTPAPSSTARASVAGAPSPHPRRGQGERAVR